MMETITTYRSVTMRLLPGSKSKAHALTDLAGTCRYAFNQILADVFSQIKLYVDDKENNPKPSYSYFSLGTVFTEWKKTAPEWVRDKAANVVKYNLKSIPETFKRSLKTNGVYGRPQFKSKKRNGVSFNVDCTSTTTKWIKGQLLNIPGLGRYRMRGSNRYSHWNLTGYTVYQKGRKMVCLSEIQGRSSRSRYR